MLSPYAVARYIVFWEFPTSIERMVADVAPSEVGRIAWQRDNDSLYLLLDTTPTWLSISPIRGVATIDFGAIGAIGNHISLDVADTSVQADSIIEASLRLEATSDHPIDDLINDPIVVAAGNIDPGVGFTIYGTMPVGNAYGDYKVNYAIFS